MQEKTVVRDIDVTVPRLPRSTLKAMAAHRVNGHWHSSWRHGRAGIAYVEHRLRQLSATSDVQLVIEVGDLGIIERPFFVIQDLSYDLLLQHFGVDGVPHFRSLNRRQITRLRDRQYEVYSHADGVLAMSGWLADSLQANGLPSDKVHIVRPAVNIPLDADSAVVGRRDGPVRRLLFVGRDFDTKAGDQVVAALALLRRSKDPEIRLTVAGPPTWPSGQVPAGVDFLGPVPAGRMAGLYDTHDLFVMPSRFEGFGIAFVEALVRGLPCIGRRACAMPEIIDEQDGGRLIETEDPEELAMTIRAALSDDELYERCAAAAPERRAYYSWDRAATETLAAVSTRY